MRNDIKTTIITLALVTLVGPLAFAQADLTIEIADSNDPVLVGEGVTYTVTVANVGDTNPRPTRADIYLPIGVPATLDAYLADDVEALAAFDALWDSLLVSDAFADDDNFGIYWGVEPEYCEGFKLQPQKFPLGPAASGEFIYQAVMPPLPAAETFVRAAGPGLDLDTTNFGRGMCDSDLNCVNTPCLGPRLTSITEISGVVEYVDDGYEDTTSDCGGGDGGSIHNGCSPFTLSAPGKIALIDRGCCNFENKLLNASVAGAAAVVVADSGDMTDGTTDPYDVLPMPCTDFCSTAFVSAPVVFLSWADGEAVKASMTEGVVSMTMGTREVDFITTSANIWQAGDSWSDAYGEDNNTWHETTTLDEDGVVDPPVASFTFDPSQPLVGETVAFTDTSSNSPSSWVWDFGDGQGTSSEQSPSYSYTDPGTYPVGLTVANDGGSDSTTADVVVANIPPPTLDHYYFVPAAAKAEGAESSFFLTELALNNTGTSLATYLFLWLPRSVDNTEPTASELYTLGPGLNALYSDVLGEIFGVDDGAVGAFAILSDSDALLLMSRTCNDSGFGTYGQSIPGYAAADLIPANARKRILFFVENDDFRSNLGLMNGTAHPLRVWWERFGPDGISIEVGFTDLPAYGNIQLNQIYRNEAPIRGGYIDVWTTTEGGAFAAYGSLLDNRTSDPTTVLPG